MNVKSASYRRLISQISTLISKEIDPVSLMANVTSLIRDELNYFWIGFYRVKGDCLVLGPFQGTPACSVIPRGKGVCGASWQKKETILVSDVESFPGHIACSSQSKSEIVVPLFYNGEVTAVLDIDSEHFETFDEDDRKGLEEIARLIERKLPPLSDDIIFNQLRSLMIADRSYRRFDGSRTINDETLKEIVELVRYCPSGRNIQSLRYIAVIEPEIRAEIFTTLKWAGYLPSWDGPEEDERPTAYLIQLIDTDFGSNPLCDDGLQLEAVTLGAVAKGLGCCIIKSFNVPKLRDILKLPSNLEPRYVVAIGYPIEKVRLIDTDGSKEADIKYYRLEDGTHIVPKRPLSELLLPGMTFRNNN